MSDTLSMILEVPQQFYKDSIQLLQRCTKPDKKGKQATARDYLHTLLMLASVEFIKITQAISAGFVVMGVIGYTIKLVHIPINNIIVYAAAPSGAFVLTGFVFAVVPRPSAAVHE